MEKKSFLLGTVIGAFGMLAVEIIGCTTVRAGKFLHQDKINSRDRSDQYDDLINNDMDKQFDNRSVCHTKKDGDANA